MLKTRIIPTLLWKDFGLVKGECFDSWRRVGSILPAVKVYNSREVDELILVDITATEQNREPDYASVAEYAAHCFVPMTVGGGISKVEHIQKLLRAGADKVCLNSVLYKDPNLVAEAVKRFGSQCIVASVDVKAERGDYFCYSHCGTQATGKPVLAWVKELALMGVGEILLTSVDRDGTFSGYDVGLVQKVVSALKIPVIASGGAGNYEHMFELLDQAKPSAVAAASIFHFTEQTPKEAKKYLAGKGVHIRGLTRTESLSV